jgi:hypothetical protein
MGLDQNGVVSIHLIKKIEQILRLHLVFLHGLLNFRRPCQPDPAICIKGPMSGFKIVDIVDQHSDFDPTRPWNLIFLSLENQTLLIGFRRVRSAIQTPGKRKSREQEDEYAIKEDDPTKPRLIALNVHGMGPLLGVGFLGELNTRAAPLDYV